ncbi:hypothetical protein MRB53_013987 [Persea americana]|uniref:Uncharacterized protein n=1 Tax=Persea americana TaxID=3435 RepID=A0ACC2K9P0_PERAE|nr:hypothetical protein MRB53_013987 [Persea americana]
MSESYPDSLQGEESCKRSLLGNSERPASVFKRKGRDDLPVPYLPSLQRPLQRKNHKAGIFLQSPSRSGFRTPSLCDGPEVFINGRNHKSSYCGDLQHRVHEETK